MITKKDIDSGKSFDWGRTSSDYAKYRDIYPPEFYEKIYELGLCTRGQQVLDLGTGTGVLPRNMYKYGANFVGTDISENQITQAKRLSAEANMNIEFFTSPAENLSFPEKTYDVITACQCFFYFDHLILAPNLASLLNPNGRVAILYMAWLPNEDIIAGASEQLILKYNPVWSGAGEFRHEIFIPEIYSKYFDVESSIMFDLNVHFTQESWNGRIKACRGVGASLSDQQIERFETEHIALLDRMAPKQFDVLHYAAMTVLKVKKQLL